MEVYQKTLECSVIIDKDIVPALEKIKDKRIEELSKNAMAIPLYVSEGHSLRFADFALALGYIEKAFQQLVFFLGIVYNNIIIRIKF